MNKFMIESVHVIIEISIPISYIFAMIFKWLLNNKYILYRVTTQTDWMVVWSFNCQSKTMASIDSDVNRYAWFLSCDLVKGFQADDDHVGVLFKES